MSSSIFDDDEDDYWAKKGDETGKHLMLPRPLEVASSGKKFALSPIQETFVSEDSRPGTHTMDMGFDFGFDAKGSDDFYSYEDYSNMHNTMMSDESSNSASTQHVGHQSYDTTLTIPSSPPEEEDLFNAYIPRIHIEDQKPFSLSDLRSEMHRMSLNSGGTMSRDVSVEELRVASPPMSLDVPTKRPPVPAKARADDYNPNHVDLRHQLQPRTKRMSFDLPTINDSTSKRQSRSLNDAIAQLECIEQSQNELMASLSTTPIQSPLRGRRKVEQKPVHDRKHDWTLSIIPTEDLKIPARKSPPHADKVLSPHTNGAPIKAEPAHQDNAIESHKMQLVPKKATVKIVRQGDRLDSVTVQPEKQKRQSPPDLPIFKHPVPPPVPTLAAARPVVRQPRPLAPSKSEDVLRKRAVHKNQIGSPVLQQTTATRIPTIPLAQAREARMARSERDHGLPARPNRDSLMVTRTGPPQPFSSPPAPSLRSLRDVSPRIPLVAAPSPKATPPLAPSPSSDATSTDSPRRRAPSALLVRPVETADLEDDIIDNFASPRVQGQIPKKQKSTEQFDRSLRQDHSKPANRSESMPARERRMYPPQVNYRAPDEISRF